MMISIVFVGLVTKSDIQDKIKKLSAEYWNYKGFYTFPSKYKGYLLFFIIW